MGCILGRPPLCVSIVPDAHGNVGQTTFPNDWPDFKGYSSACLKKREYIEIRVLTEVAATFAHDLKFPGRAHDSGDNQAGIHRMPTLLTLELGTFDGFWQCQILDTRVPALPSR